ncbi:bifunctional folylpolyglutamate synthase/dihydrofolate synthase [Thermodesulfovibrionales bacterium]|nr:bifunctional folylpolyglutamate synthase/dihydrofolate synthase [Thermodesulfovibrionales bacterium]
MTNYSDAINYLYALQKYGIELGLEKTEKILSRLGNPQRNFFSFHVSGTNGKGSVSAMIASIVMAHGFSVGLYTSPHIVSFTERIRVNNRQITETEVVDLTNEIKSRLQSVKDRIPEPTFFEFTTAMAFLYFSRNAVDWAVIEVGMGGRLDATNVIMPVVSVITVVDYDHEEFLGETLTDIATEEAGIIKRGIPTISAMQEKEAEEVICKTVAERASPFVIYGRDFSGTLRSSDIKGITFDYHDGTYTLTDLSTPLPGDHQLFNACVAVKAAMIALEGEMGDKKWKTGDLKKGLASTKWSGRLEIVSDNPLIMVDGAHNPGAATALSEFIKKQLSGYKIIFIIGIMSDKDVVGILKPLLPLASEIIFTAPDYGRAMPPERLAGLASAMGFPSKVANYAREAIEMAIKEALHPSLILITGSFYTIGEAMKILDERLILR